MSDDSDRAFYSFMRSVREHLDECLRLLEQNDLDAAVVALSKAVQLCEQHSAYCMRWTPGLGTVQAAVSACIVAAAVKIGPERKILGLIDRINALRQSGIH